MGCLILLAAGSQPSFKQVERDLAIAQMVGLALAAFVTLAALFFTIRGAVRSAHKHDTPRAPAPPSKPKHHGLVVKSMNFPEDKR